ncbi:MAG: PAS domain S-box protein [Actinobacteria bacterium]|nr:PAS domain S-box protein [Actinomycetota bacterium]
MKNKEMTKEQLINELAEMHKHYVELEGLITKRKEAGEVLRRAHAYNRSLIEASPDPLVTIGPDGKITDVNSATELVTGYSREELIGEDFSSYFTEPEKAQAGYKLVFKEGLVRDYALEIRHRDGRITPVLYNASVYRDEAGKVIGVFAAARDVTKRKEAEEVLRRAHDELEMMVRRRTAKLNKVNQSLLTEITERKLAERSLQVSHRFLQIANRHMEMTPLLTDFMVEIKNLTGCTDVGIRILDKEGNIPYQVYEGFSQRFYDLESPLSIKSDQCICINVIKGMTNPKLPFYTRGGSFHTNSTTHLLATVSEEKKGLTCNTCNQFGYESVALVPIRLGDRILGLIHVADPRENVILLEVVEVLERAALQLGMAIERVQEGEVLRQSKEFSEVILNNIAEAISVINVDDFKIVGVNNSFLQLYGLREEDVIGKRCYEITHHLSTPCSPPDNVCPLSDTLNTAESLAVEHIHYNNDGKEIYVEVSASPIRNKNGEIKQVINMTKDITGRKRSEEEIVRQANRAEALVRIASKLNANLDLEAVLATVCEETALVMHVPASSVLLYDERCGVLYLAACFGLPKKYREKHQPIPRSIYDEFANRMGPTVVISDVQVLHELPNAHLYCSFNIHTIVFESMLREGELIGGLDIFTIDEVRQFTEDELQLLKGIANQAAQAIFNARLFTNVDRHLHQTQALRTIDMAITGSLDLRVIFKVILDEVTSSLGTHAADILFLDPYTQMLDYMAGRGFRSKAIEHTHLSCGEDLVRKAAIEHNIINIANLKETDDFTRIPLLKNEGFISYCAVPLIVKGYVRGILELFHREHLDPSPEWLEFLEVLAGQAAIAIDNASLFDNLQRSNIDLVIAYDETLEGWARALDLRDKQTEGHTQRATDMTVNLARAIGVSNSELLHIRRGALLHDIGKMGIPDSILYKPDPLTDEEWLIMQKHPVYAYEMLSPITHLKPALDIPYCHHEKWDGTGYPRGLKGKQIPQAARIFSVVDVWDALCSDRPYRPAWSKKKAREYIYEQAGKHFDPKLVEMFLELKL